MSDYGIYDWVYLGISLVHLGAVIWFVYESNKLDRVIKELYKS